MRHIIMRLPDEPTAEFIYMAPSPHVARTTSRRGWSPETTATTTVACGCTSSRGRARVRSAPDREPHLAEPEISRQLSLWDQRGSEVIKGDLLVIPIEKALLYVQPIYLQADGGRIPELQRVVVAYERPGGHARDARRRTRGALRQRR
jgi:uncharacterized protein